MACFNTYIYRVKGNVMDSINLAELHTVLIISKDTEMISVWETLFQQKNCYVVNENTPQTALQAAALISPSLIVLDIELPQHARLELCSKLRAATTCTAKYEDSPMPPCCYWPREMIVNIFLNISMPG